MVKTTILAALVAAALSAAPLWATSPYAAGPGDHDNPRALRAAREEVIRKVGGEIARPLVEGHGEMAVAALKACSPEVGRKLCEWANTGALDKLSRPDEVLQAMAQPGAGDDVVLWVIENGEKALADPDSCLAFCDSPMDVSLGLQPLDKLAAAYRANRLSAGRQDERPASPPAALPSPLQQAGGPVLGGLPDWVVPVGVALGAVAVLLLLKKWMARGKEGFPATGR